MPSPIVGEEAPLRTKPALENFTKLRSWMYTCLARGLLLNDLVKFSLNLFYLVHADFDVDLVVELFDEFGDIIRNAYEIKALSNADV
jgi:hypothetical protein